MIIKVANEKVNVAENASGADVAKEVLGADEKKVVAIKKNGELQDMFIPLGESCEVEFVFLDSEEGKHILRHSAAHVMAHAIKSIYPTAKLTIGPATEDGFFYDIDFKSQIGAADLEKIENEMKKIVKANFRIERKEVSRKEALEMAEDEDETYKIDIIKQIPDGEKITIYKQGEWFDVCRGPHVRSTGMVKAFKLTNIAGAYLHGDQKNKMLTRIYGVAFPSKAEMDEYFVRLEEAKKRDHRKIGKEQELFFFDETAPGMAYWLPKGFTMLNTLIDYWRGIHKTCGYQEFSGPQLNSSSLWKTSGHWDHYKDDMFVLIDADGKEQALKPMNCPNSIKIYESKIRSYKDLPLRFSDVDVIHRNEKSGQLNGLFRVRMFRQDDSHNYVTFEQIGSEIKSILEIADKLYKVFGLPYVLTLSTRPKEYMGKLSDWNKAEAELKKVLDDLCGKGNYRINEGDGAFYGPKIDIKMKDCIGREWQMGTVQLDFQLPQRFNLSYVDKDGEKKPPIMIHRALFGSFERFIGIITEHFAGSFPLWLCPVQAIVIPVSEKSEAYAKEIMEKLTQSGIRTEIDLRAEKMGYKIREAQLQKIPYMVIVGESEAESKTISVRKRGNIEEKGLKLSDLVARMKELIENKSLEIK